MKLVTLRACLAGLLASIALVAVPVSAQTIRVSMNVSENSNWYDAALHFKKLVEERSGGRFEVEVYPNGVLANRNDRVELEMTQAGAIDIALKTTVWLSQINKEFLATAMPWIFPDAEVAMKVMDGPVGEHLSKRLEEKNLAALAWGDGAFFQLYSNQGPVKTPDDIAGVKIRVPGNPIFTDSWKQIGAVPVAMSFAEVFSALQAGTIDGGASTTPLIYSSRFYEVSKFVTMVNFNFEAIAVLASKGFLQRYPAEDQALFREAAQEAMVLQRKMADEEVDTVVQKMRDEGVNVYEPTAAELAMFKARVKPVYDRFKQEIGADFVSQIEAEVAKLR